MTCCAEQIIHDKSDGQICECVGTLGEDLDIAPSTVSHHLKELARSGLIIMTRRGQHVECRVDPDVLEALIKFFQENFSRLNIRNTNIT